MPEGGAKYEGTIWKPRLRARDPQTRGWLPIHTEPSAFVIYDDGTSDTIHPVEDETIEGAWLLPVTLRSGDNRLFATITDPTHDTVSAVRYAEPVPEGP